MGMHKTEAQQMLELELAEVIGYLDNVELQNKMIDFSTSLSLGAKLTSIAEKTDILFQQRQICPSCLLNVSHLIGKATNYIAHCTSTRLEDVPVVIKQDAI